MHFFTRGGSRSSCARVMAQVCLSVLIISLCAPMHAGVLYLPCHDGVSFVALDVCHAGSSATYSTTDMPSLCVSAFIHAALGPCRLDGVMEPSFSPPLLAYLKDRPPQSSPSSSSLC